MNDLKPREVREVKFSVSGTKMTFDNFDEFSMSGNGQYLYLNGKIPGTDWPQCMFVRKNAFDKLPSTEENHQVMLDFSEATIVGDGEDGSTSLFSYVAYGFCSLNIDEYTLEIISASYFAGVGLPEIIFIQDEESDKSHGQGKSGFKV